MSTVSTSPQKKALTEETDNTAAAKTGQLPMGPEGSPPQLPHALSDAVWAGPRAGARRRLRPSPCPPGTQRPAARADTWENKDSTKSYFLPQGSRNTAPLPSFCQEGRMLSLQSQSNLIHCSLYLMGRYSLP